MVFVSNFKISLYYEYFPETLEKCTRFPKFTLLLVLVIYVLMERLYLVRCPIWYHLHNLKNVKNTHKGVLLLVVKMQALACNFAKSNTPPCVFFSFFKLYKCYQIAQSITYAAKFAAAFYRV